MSPSGSGQSRKPVVSSYFPPDEMLPMISAVLLQMLQRCHFASSPKSQKRRYRALANLIGINEVICISRSLLSSQKHFANRLNEFCLLKRERSRVVAVDGILDLEKRGISRSAFFPNKLLVCGQSAGHY